jgi:type III secretion system YscI/HrpB-like protein
MTTPDAALVHAAQAVLSGHEEPAEAAPDPQAFSAAMQQAQSPEGASRPEDAITGLVHDVSAGFKGMMNAVPTSAEAMSNPLEVVKLQSKVMQTMASVDVTAKVAGSVSQGIKQLTTLQ